MASVFPFSNNSVGVKVKIDLEKKRRCNRIVLNSENKCGCLRELEFHDPSVKAKFDKEEPQARVIEWNRDICTCDDGPTDAFGDLKFTGRGSNQTAVSKYIRVSYKTEMSTMYRFLKKNWKLKNAGLIISVTGGDPHLNLKKELEESFCNGLLKAAIATNAWVTSGGSQAGLGAKLVGEAFKHHSMSIDPSLRIPVIGIVNWCSIANYDQLIKQANDEKSTEYNIDKDVEPLVKKCAHLDPNHSHFICVDDSKHDFGGEVVFRANLESHLKQMFSNAKTKAFCPMVVLVVGGGPNQVKFVKESVKAQTPCVFLESSGECADLFAFALQRLEHNSFSSNDLMLRAKEVYKTQETSVIEEIVKNIETAVGSENRKYLTICKVQNGVAQIDLAILRALSNAKNPEHNSIESELGLALKWNRVDIAKNYILTEENQEKLAKASLNSLMYNAILDNRVEFVGLFLDNNFCSLSHFLTYRVLLKLYNQVILTEKKALFTQFIHRKNSTLLDKLRANDQNTFTFSEIGGAIESLVDRFYQTNFTRSPLVDFNEGQTRAILDDNDEYGTKTKKLSASTMIKDTVMKKNIETPIENPNHELFMFSVLFCRFEMAKLFLSNNQNPLCSALVGTLINKTFYSKYESENCFKMALDFEEIAFEILEKLCETDMNKAKLALARQIADFENLTTLEAAVKSEALDVVDHNCFQSVINRVWYSNMFEHTHNTTFLFAIIMPLLAPVILQFEEIMAKDSKKIKNNSAKVDEKRKSVATIKMEEANDDEDESDENDDEELNVQKTTYLQNLVTFFEAPKVKFTYFHISYIGYLILYSYVILCDFNPIYQANTYTSQGLVVSIYEVILISWTFLFLIEEIKQIYNERNSFFVKLFSHFSNFWNKIDLIALVLFIVGIILRFIPNDDCFTAARILLCVDIIFWFLKSLYLFAFWRELGPRVFTIIRMTGQLMYFLIIWISFMFAFGIATQALLAPNQTLDRNLISKVFVPSFLFIASNIVQLDLIFKSTTNECDESHDSIAYGACAPITNANATAALILTLIYFLVTLVLLNLLIAIFNNTYRSIESQSSKIWKLQRYELILEFYYKPFLPPPFVIFNYLFGFIKFFASLVNIVVFKKEKEEKNEKLIKPWFIATEKPSPFEKNHLEAKRLNVLEWESRLAKEYFSEIEKKQSDCNLAEKDKKQFYASSANSGYMPESVLENKIVLSKEERKTNQKRLKSIAGFQGNLTADNDSSNPINERITFLEKKVDTILNLLLEKK